MVPLVHGNPILDPSGLGRWSGITFRGKENTRLAVLTAYRVCSGSIQSAPIGSAFAREYEYHRNQKGISSPRPRKLFLEDLANEIKKLQTDDGASILIMMDSNGQISDDRDIQTFMAECDLVDLHSETPAPSTYIGSSQRRIDHMMGCSNVKQAMTSSGSLSYIEGPQSDHRGLFVDLNPLTILRDTTAPLAMAAHNIRLLKSGNPESVKMYQESMKQYYSDHNMTDRLGAIYAKRKTLSATKLRSLLEKWDADQGKAMQHAEKQLSRPQKPFQWSPALRNAGLIYRYWRLRLKEATTGTLDYSATFQRIQQQITQHDPTFRIPSLGDQISTENIKINLNKSEKHMKQCQKDSLGLRYRSYQDLLATYENDNNPETQKESKRKSNIVKNTIKSEQCRAMYGNIRNTVKPTPYGGINRILVPRHKDTQQHPTNFQEFLATTEAHDIQWDTILDKNSIDLNLLRFNRNHFRAASASPCGKGTIHEKLTFTSLSRPASDLLKGHIPTEWYGKDELLREFLSSFATPDNIHNMEPISTLLTNEDVKYGFGKWKESTSTSPSGRHLGHYKAIIQDETLLTNLTTFLQIVVERGATLTRWSNAVNIMIEKDKGQPNITRLRIIHLFEADFNLFLKIQWGSRLVKRAVKQDLLNDGQHGSVPKRSAMDPIILTELTNDLCRLMKHNIARFDNDASACYDRIIVSLGMLAARRCGMPKNAVSTHANCLKLMKYTVKTIHGISEENYKGTSFEPLFGTGQGSGASPAVWLTLVVILMNTLDRVIPERMSFTAPDSDMKHSRLIDAFVDDTSLGFTDPGYLSLETMVAKLSHIAQTWENLLFYSGGALNLKKCAWYIMHWDWTHGRPHLRKISTADPQLFLTTQGSPETQPIKRLELNKASRILGVYLSPNGDFSEQLQVMKTKADQFAIRLRSPRLRPVDILTFHRTMYAPAMRYVLPALAVDEEELSKIQSAILPAMLNKLGFCATTPTEIRHGPTEMGGIDLMDLRTEMGISQLKYFRDSVYADSEAGQMMILNVKYSQLESGISEPIMENPGINISYLTPTWITSLRQFLYQHNLTISLTESMTVQFRGKYDQCIMNQSHLQRYSPIQQKDINLVRLHLQVITLADMSIDREHACPFLCEGNRQPGKKIKHTTWPRQPTITPKQKRLWRKYISSNYLRYSNTWRTPIGPKIVEPTDIAPTQYPSLSAYLKSLPLWYRRLLIHYEQDSTDLEIWRAFRSKRRLTIATDGSLLPTAGTFGWKITTSKNDTLFHGSGPIDGPIEIGSSTRSELGGFTGPLLLVTILARYWGLRHRCKFRWLVDSRVAINRVTFVTRKDHSPHKQPDNNDYLSVIADLYKELRRPITPAWIKSHQDTTTKYTSLSDDAKLNVDVDKLATDCHKKPRANPIRSTAHLPTTKISISINKTRYFGNMDANLRFHINGGYLKNYLQTKHGWTNAVWNSIDMQAFGRHMKKIITIS